MAFLEQGNYPGLTVSSEIYAGEGHGSEGIALTYLHGIARVYPQSWPIAARVKLERLYPKTQSWQRTEYGF